MTVQLPAEIGAVVRQFYIRKAQMTEQLRDIQKKGKHGLFGAFPGDGPGIQ